MEIPCVSACSPIYEPSLTETLNGKELLNKVELLEALVQQLFTRFILDNLKPTDEECASLKGAIGELLPIIWTTRGENRAVWKFLYILGNLNRNVFESTLLNSGSSTSLAVSLNHFAAHHEDWSKVEAYACAKEETETVDLELHARAVMAREIVCKIENKPFEVDSKLPEGGQLTICDCDRYISAYGLTSGVHFFETLLLTDTFSNSIGWATRLGNEGKSSCIDAKKLLKHVYDPIDEQHTIGLNGTFPSGTVLGCLLDFTQRSFAFYLNGQTVPLQKGVPFSSNAYYVKAMVNCFYSLSLLYFNFGQVPFKYPPPGLIAAYPTKHDLIKQAYRYSLYNSIDLMPLFDGRVEPYFADTKQGKVKDTLQKLMVKSGIRKTELTQVYVQLWEEGSFSRRTYGRRWLQAILEMMNGSQGNVNDWAILVEMIVELTSDQFYSALEGMILLYGKLPPMEEQGKAVHRILAILSATLLTYNGHFQSSSNFLNCISPRLASFLLSLFLTTADPSTAMFTLIGLEAAKDGKMPELSSTEFRGKLKYWEEVIETRKRENAFAQLHLVLHHFERFLFFSSAPLPVPTPTSLSPFKCSPEAKLSSDCLSLRSDFQWQSAHSHLVVDKLPSLALPVFYFEATLLTSGPMRIGWATQRWKVEGKSKLGGNEYSFAYDGNTGCIWHQDDQWRVRNARKWQAGDVIGCLLDLTKKQFTFYQNGERIQMNKDIYSQVNLETERLTKETVFHVYKKDDSHQSNGSTTTKYGLVILFSIMFFH